MAAVLQRREEEMRGHAAALEAAVEERTSALTDANRRLQAEVDERRSTEAALVQAQKVQAVGQLAGGIAHDFNNLLIAILGYTELALDGLEHDLPVRDELVEIRAATERAALLTQRLAASRSWTRPCSTSILWCATWTSSCGS